MKLHNLLPVITIAACTQYLKWFILIKIDNAETCRCNKLWGFEMGAAIFFQFCLHPLSWFWVEINNEANQIKATPQQKIVPTLDANNSINIATKFKQKTPTKTTFHNE